MLRSLLFSILLSGTFFCILTSSVVGQEVSPKMVITAYYMGDGSDIENYNTSKLTHIIYSFLHLRGNELTVDNEKDSISIVKLVSLKAKNKDLKIILSLGGWGGCPDCSKVFNTESGREEFAKSVKKLLVTYNADGLDLDWEYPALESVPGHHYGPEDKQNFTYLITELRKQFGTRYELSFAAGGFHEFLVKSVEWNKVMPLVDYVNVMSYDLVNGNSRRTGHLTSLFSTEEQSESTDHAVMYLDSIGVPSNKIVIGMAFYARLFSNVEPINNGLYQKGKFSGYVSFRNSEEQLGAASGFKYYWDNKAKAAYAYNEEKKVFATFDNLVSVYEKTKYAKTRKLGGVMFWELTNDKYSGGLLDMIYEASGN